MNFAQSYIVRGLASKTRFTITMKILAINGGNGVIVYPMRKHLIGNVEIRSAFKTPGDEQWNANFPGIQLSTKAEGLTDYSTVDVIVGAPNCGHSSMLAYSRAKTTSDPMKDESFELYMISLKLLKPKIFMMENLTKMLDMVSEDVWKASFPDYDLIFINFSVNYWGNSQKTRKRLLIIGWRKDHFKDHLKEVRDHFLNVYKINEIKTCGELSIGLDEEDWALGHVREDINDVITMYSGYKISLREIQKFWLANPNLKRWPVENKNFTTAPGVYRNLENGYPAVARKANRQFNQQGLQMSPRELARIQGLPDNFKILLDINRKTFTINKARTTVTKTPPYEIGRWFYKQLIKIQSWI